MNSNVQRIRQLDRDQVTVLFALKVIIPSRE